jgi:predicted RNase H-like HicB family nuclease
MMEFTVDVEREEDGRWIGEVSDLPGVLCYGATREEAVAKATALAFRILAERLDHGENILPVGPGWLAEAERRYQEIKDGKALTTPSEEVFAELAARRQK